jgi:hypothetical protein
MGPRMSSGPRFNVAPSGTGPAYRYRGGSGPKLMVGSNPRLRSVTGPSGKYQAYKSGKGQRFTNGKTQFVKTPGGKLRTFGKGQAFPQKHAAVYRPWHRKRYYGRRFAGVLIGSIVAASVYYSLYAPPDPDVCWYWADPDQTRGYWDFCDEPPPGWY